MYRVSSRLYRWFLTTFSILLLISACAVPGEKKNRKYNVILILADDLGWSDLEAYGNRYHETPNLDLLAKESVLFTNAYASAPVCSPTRASILTGKYPATLNLTDWIPGRQHTKGILRTDQLIPPNFEQQLVLGEYTLAEVLKSHGYVTANIGKWHLGDSDFYPEHQGFDINVTGNHNGSPPSYFYPYESKWKKEYRFEELEANGKEGEYLTDRLTNEAIDFVKQHKDSSFFLYLPHYAVHTPLMAKDSLIKYYKNKAKGLPDGVFNNPIYAAMIHSLDEGVGRIMDILKQMGIDDNTIIIFTSDNGGLAVKEGKNTPATISAPLRQGKGYLGEGGIRVPLIVKWPEVSETGSTDQMVGSVDILPTILEGLNILLPQATTIDGESFLNNLGENSETRNKPLYWHYPHYSNQGGRPSGAIREGDYKLIEYYEDSRIELFDLEEDLGETNNLAEKFPEKTRELFEKLKAWRVKVKANMPAPNPDYNPNFKTVE